jgi:large repetitive protein
VNLASESIVTPPSHGTATINSDGSITYQNDNSANASDSFQFVVNDTAGNPANVETVNLTVQDQVNPTITITSPPADGSGSYPYQSVVDAAYSCGDNVLVASCTASQSVDSVDTPVANGSPLDTSSLIVGDTHSITVTAVDWAGNTTTQTVNYKVVTPGPVANADSAHTINPNEVTIPVLNNDTSTFPLDPTTVTIISPPTSGTAVPQLSGVIRYTPTQASTTSVTTDTFTYTVTDTDGQVSPPAMVTVTIYPVPGVSAISPTAGPLAAGTSVTITGTGFNTATAVDFGSVSVPFTVNSNTSITATAPAAPGNVPGSQDVSVTTAGGPSPASAADVFTWDPVPTVTGVSPFQGVAGGGGTITVTGTGFTSGGAGQSHVFFGSTPATSVVVNSGTQLTATIPATTTPGTVDVTVATPGGTSPTSSADHYAYFFTPPSVNSVSPSAGPVAGGTSVTITGNAFTGATGVSFGATPAASFTVNSNGSITAVSPPGTAGTRVDITVTGPGGTSNTLPADQFTYGPQVTSVSPHSGGSNGGTTVTIAGAGFTGATNVSFGSSPALSFTVNSDGSITATTPAGSSGTVDVTVTTAAGTSATSVNDQFTYLAPSPTVSGVSPSSGPVAGGQTVTIAGNAFNGATAVKFGGVAATTFAVGSSSSITATTPAGTAGTVDVTVTTPGGTSVVNAGDHYTYGPAITGVSPATGGTNGATTVTITGTDFTGATGVSFGSTPALSYTVNSATSVTAVSPAGSAGAVNITVTTPDGTSPVVSADTFTYSSSAPTVTAVSPSSGAAAGGTSVTISGSGFSGATAVKFGGVAATTFAVGSSSSITATAPAGTAGSTVDITVTGPGGTSATGAADHFTYGGVITHISVTSGSIAGGSTVVITGTGFTGATGVTFGGTVATSYTVNSATQITAVSPAHAAGTVDIVVATTGGPTPTSSVDQFTYTATKPVISSITPTVGKPGGGDVVTITGSGFTGATTVSFGSTPGTGLTVNSATSITVTSPAGVATSTVDITVTGPGGTSATTTADKFTYGPVVTSVSPNTGSHLGGTTVTIKGAGFTGATSVQFGSTSVTTGITVNAAGTQITVKAPAGAAGSVNITVTAGGFTSLASASETFTYV